MSVISLSKFKEPDLVCLFKLLVLCNDIKCLKQGKKRTRYWYANSNRFYGYKYKNVAEVNCLSEKS